MTRKKGILFVFVCISILFVLTACSTEIEEVESQESTSQSSQENTNGLQSHQIWSASSTDGLTWTYVSR